DLAKLATVQIDPISGQQTFMRGGAALSMPAAQLDSILIQLVELKVIVTVNGERIDVYNELGADDVHKRFIGKILQRDNPEDENAVIWLKWDPTGVTDAGPKLMVGLQSNPPTNTRLTGGDDGQ